MTHMSAGQDVLFIIACLALAFIISQGWRE